MSWLAAYPPCSRGVTDSRTSESDTKASVAWTGLITSARTCTRLPTRAGRALRRLDLAHEAFHPRAHLAGLGGDGLGGAEHLGRGLARALGHLAHPGDVARHLGGAVRGILDIAGDRMRGRVLLLDRGRDRGVDAVDPADHLADLVDRGHRLVRELLDRFDLRRHFLGRLAGL